MKKLIIIGAGGHGKVVADIACCNGYEDIAFLDDDITKNQCAGFNVVGTIADAVHYRECDFIVAIGSSDIRKGVQKRLEGENFNIITLIHPNAVVSRRVGIGLGSVIMAGVVINSDTSIGKGCIINTGASIDHDGQIKEYVHISVGAHIAGDVVVESGCWVGAGAVVINDICICKECVIGAGAIVIRNITEPGTYIGVPARKLKGN